MVWVQILLTLLNIQCLRACMSSHGVLELVRELQRIANKTSGEAQRLSPEEERAVDVTSGSEKSNFFHTDLRSYAENVQVTSVAEAAFTELPVTSTSKFDDPNFIPGEFLDSSGEAKFVTHQPSDILTLFMSEMKTREERVWQVAVFVLACWVLQAICIVVPVVNGVLVLRTYRPAQKLDQELNRLDLRRHKKREPDGDYFLELAKKYEQNRITFAHLPGFGIPDFDRSLGRASVRKTA